MPTKTRINTMPTVTRKPTIAELHTAVRQYRALRHQAAITSDVYHDTPDDMSDKNQQWEAQHAAFLEMRDSEIAMIAMVVALTGRQPKNYRPIGITIDGMPIIVSVDYNGDMFLFIPQEDDVLRIEV